MRTERERELIRLQKERYRRKRGVKPRVKLTEAERKAKKKESKIQYKSKFPEKIAAERRRYYNKAKDRPEFKIAKNLRKRLKKRLSKTTQLGKIDTMLGCSVADLKLHLESQFINGMSWSNYGEWHIDHIKPVCAFNLECPEERKLVNHYSNLRPLWAKDNSDKAMTDKLMKFKK